LPDDAVAARGLTQVSSDKNASREKAGREPRRHLTIARQLVVASVLAAILVTLISFLGRTFWVAELLTHFRMQLVAGSIVLCCLSGVLRLPRSALLATLPIAVNLIYLLPYVVTGPGEAMASPVTFRMLAANVSFRNRNHAALRDLIHDAKPDVVGLSEVDREWVESLLSLDYPYRILRPAEGPFGLALFSRLPLRELKTSPYREDGVQTAILAEVEMGDTRTALVLAHVRAPTSPAKARQRNRQLEDLAAFFRDNGDEAEILFGDLNITPWSPYYTVLESGTGLVNAARESAYRPTWPRHPAVLRIPIDHFLLSGRLNVASIRTGPAIGSDHLPLIVDIAVATH
jgi:endonuclease/exonuclease/phosphatase (EEP) superfamily protein YafD